MVGFRVFADADIPVIVLAEIGHGFQNIVLDGILPVALLQLAADEQQQVVQQRGQQLLKPGLAQLELQNHPLENPPEFRPGPRAVNVPPGRKAIVSQDVLDVIAREVDPEHLRVIRSIVDIPLLLGGAVQHHAARAHRLLLPAESSR